ncbi:MAG: PAS domain S-box protein [Myxococcaceae bacterium]|nr:PAS domain S-box protein [Myxococcaceae bacterium]MCA3011597.1 PAS domain S-box protein [Myxococcaceae bacterium]
MPVVSEVTTAVDVAVIDVTSPEGVERRRELTRQWPRLGVLAIASGDVALESTVLEVVAPQSLETELLPRLGRLRARLVSQQDAVARQRDLKVLLELTARYAEATNIEELLHDVTRKLAADFDIDRATLVVIDAERQQGSVIAASDDAGLKDLRIELSRYPEIREAVRTGKPVIVEDAPSHPLLEDVKESVRARDIRNIAVFPLSVGGRVLAVLLVRRSSERGAFNPREVDFLTTVAHATAVAFRNIRQLDRERGRRELEKTARLAAEERIEELGRYASYFAHLSDGVAILDSRACVLSLNPAGEKQLDLEPGAAVGRHVNALTNPVDDALLLDVLYSVSKGQTRTDVDLHARTGLGRRLILSISAAPLTGDTDQGVAILTMRDVTRQRQMADELKRTKEYLERLIDSSVDAIIAADTRGNVTLFNKAAERVTGWRADEVIGKVHVTQLYPEGIANEVMQRLRSGEHGGPGRLATSRYELVSSTGEHIPVNMTASIIFDGTREMGTVGLFTDLRDRLNLERKLTDVEARLLESEKNAVIVALAGTTAHELNQPLTSVMGYAELLKRKLKGDDPSARAVDIIFREAERMAEIVRKIGKITRYETMSYVGNSQIVDLDKASSREE